MLALGAVTAKMTANPQRLRRLASHPKLLHATYTFCRCRAGVARIGSNGGLEEHGRVRSPLRNHTWRRSPSASASTDFESGPRLADL
jgi:hypothetical protein